MNDFSDVQSPDYPDMLVSDGLQPPENLPQERYQAFKDYIASLTNCCLLVTQKESVPMY